MSELVTVTLKMSAELRDRLKARAAEDGGSVSSLLVAGAELVLVGGVISGPDVASSDQAAEIAALQADVARLKRELAAARAQKPESKGVPAHKPAACHPAGGLVIPPLGDEERRTAISKLNLPIHDPGRNRILDPVDPKKGKRE